MLSPLVINGDVWRIEIADPEDPVLVDRTGSLRLAVTDHGSMTVYMARDLKGPMFDTVLLHEATHAAMVSYGMLDGLHSSVPEDYWVYVEEWACNVVANHGREIVQAVDNAMPRLVIAA